MFGHLVDRFFTRGPAASTSEIEAAQKNLNTVIDRVVSNSGTGLTPQHVEDISRAAYSACRSKTELRKYHNRIVELNRPLPDSVSVSQASPSEKELKILIVSGMAPSVKHGGGLRLFDIINELPQSYTVDLYCRYRKHLDKTSIDLLRPRLTSIKLVRKLKLKQVLEWLSRQGRLNGYYDVIQFEYPGSIKLMAGLTKHANRSGFTFMEAQTRGLAIDLVNTLENGVGGFPPELSRRFVTSLCGEAKAMFYCDFTIAVTEEDARFCSTIGSAPPEVVPHGVSKLILDDARDSNIPIDWSELPKSAVFVGYFGHSPNTEAVQWYLRNVHPIVLNKIPSFTIYIVGGGKTEVLKQEFEDDPSVIFTGWVDRLGPWIAKGCICISPLISGAGLRGKINQYSAYQRPTVSTTIGVSGTEYKNGESVLIADDPTGFANAMLTLLQDEAAWSRVRQKSLDVASSVTWPRIIEKLCRIYENNPKRLVDR